MGSLRFARAMHAPGEGAETGLITLPGEADRDIEDRILRAHSSPPAAF